MRILILALLCVSAWGATCTSTGAGTTSGTNWDCGSGAGATPANGDNLVVNHAVSQNRAGFVAGSDNAPVLGYVASVTTTAGSGYTSCSGVTFTGGTAATNASAAVAFCRIVSGVPTIMVIYAGVYTTLPTGVTVTASGGTGAAYTVNTVAGGGTPAIKVGTAGTLTFDAATTISGDASYAAQFANSTDAYVISPGVTVTMDGGVGTKLRWFGRSDAIDGYRTLRTACSANPCYLTGSNGYVTVDSGYIYGANQLLDGLVITNGGGLNHPAINFYGRDARNAFQIQNCTLINSNRAHLFGGNTTGTFFYKNNEHRGSLTNSALDIETISVPVSFEISGNILDAGINGPDPSKAAPANILNISGNYVTGNIVMLSPTTTAQKWSNFADNVLVARRNPYNALNGPQTQIAGDVTRFTHVFDEDSYANWHATTFPNLAINVNGAIFQPQDSGTGDSGEYWTTPTSTGYASGLYTILNFVGLCNASGQMPLEAHSPTGVTAPYRYQNMSMCAGYGNFGIIQMNETQPTIANTQYMVNSVMYAGWGGGGYLKTTCLGTCSNQDMLPPAKGNYNFATGFTATQTSPTCSGCTNQGNGYGGNFSATPGANDVNADARVVDPKRGFQRFDIEYLGFPVATAWSSGGTYAFGDIVSSNHSSMFSGRTFNFRCIVSGGCTGAIQPGVVGTAWRSYWEWAALYRIRQALIAKTSYSDFGLTNVSVLRVLYEYLRYGQMPTNPRAWNAACVDANYDGTCEANTAYFGVDSGPLRRAAGAASFMF